MEYLHSEEDMNRLIEREITNKTVKSIRVESDAVIIEFTNDTVFKTVVNIYTHGIGDLLVTYFMED